MTTLTKEDIQHLCRIIDEAKRAQDGYTAAKYRFRDSLPNRTASSRDVYNRQIAESEAESKRLVDLRKKVAALNSKKVP